MSDATQVPGTPAWFEGSGKAGQEEGTGEQLGEELAVEDEGEALEEVPPAELQPPAEELKTKGEQPKKPAHKLPKAATRHAPTWAKVPKGMRFPKGIDVLFVRIRGELTMYPGKGDRQVILWPMTDGDQKIALGRAMGDRNRAAVEMTKQIVRAIDGQPVNWTGDPSAPGIDVDRFWHEIGPKGRNLLDRLFVQLNMMNEDELVDFFEHCIAAARTG